MNERKRGKDRERGRDKERDIKIEKDNINIVLSCTLLLI